MKHPTIVALLFLVIAASHCEGFFYDSGSAQTSSESTTYSGSYKAKGKEKEFSLAPIEGTASSGPSSASGTVKVKGDSLKPGGSRFKGKTTTTAKRTSGTEEASGSNTSGAAGKKVKSVKLISDSGVKSDGSVYSRGGAKVTGRKSVISFSKSKAEGSGRK